MEELRNFRKINHLTQGQLGDYLGIKKSFISRVENGQVALPLDKFKKLMENTMGWDTSVLKRFYETYDPKSPRPIHVIDLFSGPKKNVAESPNRLWRALNGISVRPVADLGVHKSPRKATKDHLLVRLF